MTNDYGCKFTLTTVLNDDNYNIGCTYNDSIGTAIDKQFKGAVGDLGDDITGIATSLGHELMSAFADYDKKCKEQAETEEKAAKIESEPDKVKPEDDIANRFAVLEEENRQLREQVDKLLADKKEGQVETPCRNRSVSTSTPRHKHSNMFASADWANIFDSFIGF